MFKDLVDACKIHATSSLLLIKQPHTVVHLGRQFKMHGSTYLSDHKSSSIKRKKKKKG